MLGRDVADQLLHEHGLADARAAEQADLSAQRERAEQVDDLQARLELLDRGRLLFEARRLAVDGQALLDLDLAALVDRLADHVHDAAERARAHGHA